MNRFFRAIIAAWGAKKLGGGCLSTIVIFIAIYMLLGKCNQTSRATISKPASVKVQPAAAICGKPVSANPSAQ
jgi:hypothetical protein